MALLEASGLNVAYRPRGGQRIWSVRDLDLSLDEGEFVGLVGESGCGKSTLGYALTRMLRPPAQLESGEIRFAGNDISRASEEQVRRQRRGGIALVLQSGMNALSPVRRIERHFADVLSAHARPGEDRSKAAMRRRGAELLGMVELPDHVLRRYPHELSGGMRQRVAIALALALQPRLIVFDEPTTALDVIVQAAVMRTIKKLQAEQGFTALLISHDLGVVLEATDRLLVMYAGRIVQDQPSATALTGTHHPYTEALLGCYGDPRADLVQLGGIAGSPPDLSQPLPGCAYAPRCPLAEPICSERLPVLAPPGLAGGAPTGLAGGAPTGLAGADPTGLAPSVRLACHVRAPAGRPIGAHDVH